jgi:hypothetical protein
MHCYLPSQAGHADIRLVDLQGFGEVARCYTIAPAIVTPEIMPIPLAASRSAQCRTPDFGGLRFDPNFSYN